MKVMRKAKIARCRTRKNAIRRKRVRIACAGAYWRGWNYAERHSDRDHWRTNWAVAEGRYARDLLFYELIERGEADWTSSRRFYDLAPGRDLSQAPERVKQFFLTRGMKKREIEKLGPLLLSGKQVRKMIGMTPAAAIRFDDTFPLPINDYTTLDRWRRTDIEEWLRMRRG